MSGELARLRTTSWELMVDNDSPIKLAKKTSSKKKRVVESDEEDDAPEAPSSSAQACEVKNSKSPK